MNKKIIAIAAIAVLSGLAAVSCGKDVGDDSEVSVALPKVTVAQDEKATTQSGETTKANSKTTAVVVSGSGENSSKEEDTTKNTETTAAEDGETKTDGDTNANTGGDEPQVVETPTEQQTEAPAAQSLNKTVFGINDLSQAITSVISNPDIPETVPACIPKGDEGGTVYRYKYGSDLSFDCYSSGGVKCIANIYIYSSNYSLDSGITVGSTKDSVISAYGETASSGSYLLYSFGDKELYFGLNGDTVSEIQINYV